MTASKDNQAKEKKTGEKRVRKNPNPNQKRGQPTAAARLISSPYIKFGWHKPLGGEVKDAIQRVSSMADSMYMLQIERERPIEALSIRNGLFWEQRQLVNDEMISTPAVDHIDLFPEDDALFHETIRKIGKQFMDDKTFAFHYLFSKMRMREFLILPIEINGYWATVIAQMRAKSGDTLEMGLVEDLDREVTSLAIIDPAPKGREYRRTLITTRLTSILREGCIELSDTSTANRAVAVLDVEDDQEWKTGLVAYAISREFLRRLKTLQWRRSNGVSTNEEDLLWAPFEEDYNFDAYRQSLMAACAYQCIEMSGYQVRLALEVPSEDSNYKPGSLSHIKSGSFFKQDEKWEVFQSPTHTFIAQLGVKPRRNPPPSPGFNLPMMSPDLIPSSPSFSPTSPGNDEPMSPNNAADGPETSLMDVDLSVTSLPDTDMSEQNAPVAPMAQTNLSPIPGLSLVNSPEAMHASLPTAPVQQQEYAEPTLKRPLAEDDDYDDEDEDMDEVQQSPKRIKIEEET
ncbi:hypothetical protein O1611_g353 [Lasiodiplodia mahajangana]|uniref:Uncharacterized protein n=1 Tax=Lasiodiplodia mahajangana TaxID=1108764 RepID=A0ACC2K0E3_9PEZI|nr:hypothetical protein O1611_g353 [Lasiodiplodia mahajangana]